MAYPMLRSEASFKRPGEYKSYVEAEALQKGKYLADMDTVFAQLGETAREFDKTLAFKEKTLASSESQFAQTLDWTKEAFGKEFGLKERAATISEGGLDLQKEQLELERDKLEVYRQATLGSSLRQGNIHLGGYPLVTPGTGEKSPYKTGQAYPSNASPESYEILPSSGEVSFNSPSSAFANDNYTWDELRRVAGY